MSRITITIAIDVPDGSSISVRSSGSEGDFAPPPIGDFAPPEYIDTAFDDTGSQAWGNPQICPDHKVAFTWKEGGISKAGKAYDGFWKCGQKNHDGSYCQRKPQ